MAVVARLFFVALPPVSDKGELQQHVLFCLHGRLEPFAGDYRCNSPSDLFTVGIYELPNSFFGKHKSWPPYNASWSVADVRRLMKPV